MVWCRYSSYGRHFTKLHLLEQVAQLLSFYLHDGDTVVDFSCGANAFVPLVKQEGRKQGLSLKGKAYDIITSQNMEDVERTSWLDTRPGQQPISLSAPGNARSCLGRPVLCCVLAYGPVMMIDSLWQHVCHTDHARLTPGFLLARNIAEVAASISYHMG